MNKVELASAVAEKVGSSKKQSTEVVDVILNVIKDELVDGGEIAITGFGKFSVVDRDARVARNPLTGEDIQVPAKKAVKFKASSTLKAEVNE